MTKSLSHSIPFAVMSKQTLIFLYVKYAFLRNSMLYIKYYKSKLFYNLMF